MDNAPLIGKKCPRCGGELPRPGGLSTTIECPYCRTSFKARDIQLPSFKAAGRSPEPPSEADSSQRNALPAEFRSLRRPPVSNSPSSSGCQSLFALIWTLFSAVFVVIGVGFYLHERQVYNLLANEGRTVSAVITQMEIDEDDDGDTYTIYYRFQGRFTNGAQTIEDADAVSRKIYERVQVGQKIDVIYAPSDATLSRISDDFGPPNILLALVFSGMGGLFVVIGLGLLAGGIRSSIHLSKLKENGQSASATLIDRWSDTDSDGDRQYFIAYAFYASTQNGERRLVTRSEQNRTAHQTCHVGDSLRVEYLPENPQVCRLAEF